MTKVEFYATGTQREVVMAAYVLGTHPCVNMELGADWMQEDPPHSGTYTARFTAWLDTAR